MEEAATPVLDWFFRKKGWGGPKEYFMFLPDVGEDLWHVRDRVLRELRRKHPRYKDSRAKWMDCCRRIKNNELDCWQTVDEFVKHVLILRNQFAEKIAAPLNSTHETIHDLSKAIAPYSDEDLCAFLEYGSTFEDAVPQKDEKDPNGVIRSAVADSLAAAAALEGETHRITRTSAKKKATTAPAQALVAYANVQVITSKGLSSMDRTAEPLVSNGLFACRRFPQFSAGTNINESWHKFLKTRLTAAGGVRTVPYMQMMLSICAAQWNEKQYVSNTCL